MMDLPDVGSGPIGPDRRRVTVEPLPDPPADEPAPDPAPAPGEPGDPELVP
jgi:hypothetical protein